MVKGVAIVGKYPYELRLPLAPYRFEWRDEPPVSAEKRAGEGYAEERYTHADGSTTIIREYSADGSYHIMSDRGEIELVDNASDPYAASPISVVRVP
jgi:hypothetical protein